MALIRWSPANEVTSLTNAINRLFADSFGGADWPASQSSRQMAVNLKETKDAYMVEAMLPGVKPEDVDVQINNGMLTIKGEYKQQEEKEDEGYICKECYEGSFYRQISLPSHVQADKTEAKAENGILTITVPKAPEAQPKKITVNTK